MIKVLLTLFVFINLDLAFAQLPNIAFNGTNNWTTGSNLSFNTSQNQVTIIGNGTSYIKTELYPTLSNPPSVFYLSLEVKLTNIAYHPENIKNPQIVVRDDNSELIGRMNLNAGLENQWFKTGIRIENYSANTLKIEIGVNNTTGTMIVKNPVLTTITPTFTYEFPFIVPSNVSSSLEVDLTQKHSFENDLLSTNSHFVYATYQWGSTWVNNAINTYFPMSNIRFPGGTVGNHYNYVTDTFYLNSTTPNNLYNIANNGYVFNYNGYKDLVVNSGATSTLMFNVLTNTPQQSKAEYQIRVASGLPIKWIEIGNEMFFQDNQTGNITDVASYISHAQQFSSQLKSVNPNVQVAVCLEKDDFTSGEWNHSVSQNQSYFDAGVFHNYIAVGNYFYGKYDAYAMLKSYKTSITRFNQYALMFPTKPLLLTEWGITTNVDEPYFLQTLGIADAFLAIEKANQNGIVHQAGIHMLYKNDANSESTLLFKGSSNQVRLTTNGVLYAKLFEVFKNAEVFNADVVSADLETNLKSVYGKMTKKGNQYQIFLVNKLPVASPFTLTVNNVSYTGNYSKETYTANMNIVTPDVAATSSNWNTSTSSGGITLPASSINVISIAEADLSTALGLSNYNQNPRVKFFPNPAQTELNFTSLPAQPVRMQILNMTGLKIKEFNLSHNTVIDVHDIPAGTYIIKLFDRDSLIQVEKLLKE
jgi:hypothetical protein